MMVQGCKAEDASDLSRAVRVPRAEEKTEERDLRVLPVIFDSAEERWRTLHESMRRSRSMRRLTSRASPCKARGRYLGMLVSYVD